MDRTLPSIGIDQHNKEIQENLRHWNRKPTLREQYAEFYRLIAKELEGGPSGPILECGSGIGNLKSVLPCAITSDLFPNPWLDRQENVYALNFADSSLGAVVLFDVFHHLQFPGTALAEIRRVLKPGGRLIIFEPAMGWMGRAAFGLFHHEPLGLTQNIRWAAPASFDPATTSYYAAQGNAWRVFVSEPSNFPLEGLSVRSIQKFPALGWLLSGGFRGPQLWPSWAKSVPRVIERCLLVLPAIFASRMLVCIEKL